MTTYQTVHRDVKCTIVVHRIASIWVEGAKLNILYTGVEKPQWFDFSEPAAANDVYEGITKLIASYQQ